MGITKNNIALLLSIIFIAGCVSQTGQTTFQPSEPAPPPSSIKPQQQGAPEISQPLSTECTGTFEGVVDRIIDGDTLVIEGCSSNVRLAIVNTPEYFESGFVEAKSFTENLCLVGSTTIVDQDDLQPYDNFERIVGVVYCQNKSLNAELIYNDLAVIDSRFCSTSEFADENWAKNYGCEIQPVVNETIPGCFSVLNFHYDAEGNDNYNLNDEYATIQNNCDFPINMTGWVIRDAATHVYTFSAYTFNPRSMLTLYTGIGTDTNTNLYWGRAYGAVWNNDGDTLHLLDALGNQAFFYTYP